MRQVWSGVSEQRPPCAAPNTTALLWDRSTALDLASHRIYRAEGPAAFAKVGATRDSPSYSDRKIEAGKNYRYAVTAFDNAGNESGMSATAEVTAQ